MTTTSPYSAAPSAIGYLYQIRLALLALIEAPETIDADEDRLAISIEAIDDVALFRNEAIEKMIQSKSHLNLTKNLTDGGEDLWKTLRVWIDAKALPGRSEDTLHCLFTTSTAAPDSACALLRPGEDRNIAAAVKLLDAACKASEAVALRPAMTAWLRLLDADKQSLLKTVQVLDNSPNAIDIANKIGLKLFRHRTKADRDEMVQRLEGWWFDRVFLHLYQVAEGVSADVIQWSEVRLQVNSIMADFGLDALPNEYGSREPDVPIDPDTDRRFFVEQLRSLGIGKPTMSAAIRDHWRAYEQRSKWIRDTRVLPEELKAFNKLLIEEWELCADEHWSSADIQNLTDSRDAGKKVFHALQARVIPLRQFNERFLTRGSYHILADTPAVVGWHPSWPSIYKTWQNALKAPNESAA